MLRRSTGVSLETKRVGASMESDMRVGEVKVRCVACDRLTSGASASVEAVGMMALPDAIDCRSSRRASWSMGAIVFARHAHVAVSGLLEAGLVRIGNETGDVVLSVPQFVAASYGRG